MINDNTIQSKRPSDVTKKYFLNWILVAELLCFTKRFRGKVNNDDVSKILTTGERMIPPATLFLGTSGTYSRIIFTYVVLRSLLLFLNILLNVNNGDNKICETHCQLLLLSLLADIEQVNVDWVKPLFQT